MTLVSNQSSGFDEEKYLKANPDLREALAAGVISSGFEHYLRWGYRERRQGASWAMRPAYQPIGPMPPEALRLRVSGSADQANFEEIGRQVCDDILTAMEVYQISLSPGSHVLDFGCGCGRVLRHFAPQSAEAQIDGVDIDPEPIDWCRANFPDGMAFQQNGEWPPLPFKDARFDLIYCVSVFTHLPEEMQFAWLKELARVARPGAWLLLSTHAPGLMPNHIPALTEQMQKGGFAYLRGEPTEGLPDFYRTAYHDESYIRREWGKLFRIEAVIGKGIANFQDLVVARASFAE